MNPRNDFLLYIGIALISIIIIQNIYGIINGAVVYYSIDTEIQYKETISNNANFNTVIKLTNKGNYPTYGYIIIKMYNASLVNESISVYSMKYHEEFYLKYNFTSTNQVKDKKIVFCVNEDCTYSMVSILCTNDWSHDYKADYFVSYTDFIGKIPVTIMFKETEEGYVRQSETQMALRMKQLRDNNFFYKDARARTVT
jgi:hypothetical protein